MNRTKLALLPLTFICYICGASAAPTDWAPTLAPAAQGEYRDPMEILRIKLPAKLPVEVLKTLALELDNIDVTAMVSRNGDYAELSPLQPLPWGTHTLRLVEYAEDGSINEKAYWEFQVRRTSTFRELDYAADINLMASQRIADKNLTPPEPSEFTGQGSAVLQGRVADNDWEVSGQMDLIYNSQEELTINQKSLDMGSYLVSGRKSDNQLNLGHHTLAQTSLVMEGFNRRGVSASTRIDSFNSAATGFVMRPDVVIGFQKGLGLSDSTNRVSGVILEAQPLKNAEALYVSATYLTGEQTLAGATVGSTIDNQLSDAMSLVADSTVLDRRLRVRGEVAASKVSIDYTDPLASDIADENNNAVSLLTTWTPLSVPGQTFFWNTGIEASQVDTFFASLANPTLPSDKQLNRLFFNTDWSGISAQLSTALETNNVNDLEDRPVIETQVNQVFLNYAFNQPTDENSWVNWLGIPSLSLQWRGMTQDQIKEAITVFYQDLDLDTDISQFTTNFSYTNWSWGLLYGESEQIDHINALEQFTYSRGLNANLRLGEHISVMPALQQQTTQFSFDGSESDTQIISLSGQFLAIDTWNGNLMFNKAETESNAALPQNNITNTVAMQFTWNWILPKNKRPGFDVILSGSWQKLEDAVTPVNGIETYQVFLSLAMKLPISSAQ